MACAGTTLQRLLADGQAATIGPYLRRSCNSETIAACAVFEGRTLVAQAGVALPWLQILDASSEQGERFLAVPTATPYAVLAGTGPE